MGYCTTDELVALSGTTLDATTILTPIIAAADREIDAFLTTYGLTGSSTQGAIKQASLKLSMAGLLERGLHTGIYEAVSGDFENKTDIIKAIESNRAAAYKLLEMHVNAQTSITPTTATVRRVDGI
ncbi:MAG TPA: hypothetical protein PLN56_09710 [Methanoregulaceae archaeon]|nr:hypothetical protein [Methanoregulaceae archaeon]